MINLIPPIFIFQNNMKEGKNMDFMSYLSKDSIILVAAVYVLGMMLKNTKKIPDYVIPFILLTTSIGFCVAMNGVHVSSFVQAILIVAVAVYSNQLVKQSTEAFVKADVPETPQEINPTNTTDFRK